jgi:ABC-type sugar transport system permease subunit
MKKGINYAKLKKGIVPYLLLVPSIILIGIFKIYPILYSIVNSFFKTGRGGVVSFAGFQNYISLFSEKNFVNSIFVTLKFCILATAIQVVLAIALALFLNRNMLVVRIARTLIYIPVAVNMVIACTIWNMFFSTSTGLANTILKALGLPEQPWLTSSKQALYVLIFIACWKGISYWMMFLLAGLQNVGESVHEAALLDGAGYFTELFKVTLPLLKNSLLFVIVSDTLINVFMFVPVYLMTQGGPSMSTDTLMYEAYRSAFGYGNYPRAYALVSVMLVIAIMIAGIQFYIMRDKDEAPKKRRRKHA